MMMIIITKMEDLYLLHFPRFDFLVIHGKRGVPNHWESRFKQEILEFLCTHSYENFLD